MPKGAHKAVRPLRAPPDNGVDPWASASCEIHVGNARGKHFSPHSATHPLRHNVFCNPGAAGTGGYSSFNSRSGGGGRRPCAWFGLHFEPKGSPNVSCTSTPLFPSPVSSLNVTRILKCLGWIRCAVQLLDNSSSLCLESAVPAKVTASVKKRRSLIMSTIIASETTSSHRPPGGGAWARVTYPVVMPPS
jgi:hypothetical protein